MGIFLGSQFSSLGLLTLFLEQYHTVLVNIALEYSLTSGSVMPPSLFYFLKISLAIQGFFSRCPMNFRIVSSNILHIHRSFCSSNKLSQENECIFILIIQMLVQKLHPPQKASPILSTPSSRPLHYRIILF